MMKQTKPFTFEQINDMIFRAERGDLLIHDFEITFSTIEEMGLMLKQLRDELESIEDQPVEVVND